MECRYFSLCGACRSYEGGYEAQLQRKVNENSARFARFYDKNLTVLTSKTSHFRARSEFKIWHSGDDEISYAMGNITKDGTLLIDECPQVNEHIFALMPKLLEKISQKKIGKKLFGIDFLSSQHGEMVVSMLYHRKLDDEWLSIVKDVAVELGVSIIGRSRNQKLVIGQDFVTEELAVLGETLRFKHIENSFTQPNPSVNEKMVEWAMRGAMGLGGDLLELYCGAGNFTIAFAKIFNKVMATEISKSSIAAAKENMRFNSVENIEFLRMDVNDFIGAIDGVREYNRMRGVDMSAYDLKSIFVDPPRSGLGEVSALFSSRFENIIYISCNPQTLELDLEMLTKTHEVVDMALFDQFAYTNHAEMGVILKKRSVL